MDGAMIGWLVAMGVFWILILYGALMDPGGGDDSEIPHQQDTDLHGEVRRLRPLDDREVRRTGRRFEQDEGERMEGDHERKSLL